MTAQRRPTLQCDHGFTLVNDRCGRQSFLTCNMTQWAYLTYLKATIYNDRVAHYFVTQRHITGNRVACHFLKELSSVCITLVSCLRN